MNAFRIPEQQNRIAALGHMIYEAERDRRPLPPLSRDHPDLTPTDAYAIQEAYAMLRQTNGARLVGRKIGVTSKAMQDLFRIDTPDFGHLFDDMITDDGSVMARDELVQPMVEPELAFVLEEDLAGPGVSFGDALDATAMVVPCLEIIDSRIVDWHIQFVDTVADNGSSARCVLGADRVAPDHLDLPAVLAKMRHNGRVVGHATGEAVLGHPARAVAWLANALSEFDRSLRAGDYVLSGSLMTAVRAERGDTFEATFEGVGRVACSFA